MVYLRLAALLLTTMNMAAAFRGVFRALPRVTHHIHRTAVHAIQQQQTRGYYSSLTRADLQVLAKQRGIKANLASAEIIRLLDSQPTSGDSPQGILPPTPGPAASAAVLPPSPFTRGQAIFVKIIKFGPLGASVSVTTPPSDNPSTPPSPPSELAEPAYGLVLQREIALFRDKHGDDVIVGDIVPAFVERVRDDGRLGLGLGLG